jgi:mercuric ion binding protein
MMKKLMTVFITLALAAYVIPSIASTMIVDVNGMVCAFCAQGIEKNVRALPQAKTVYVNLEKKVVAIELKDKQTLPDNTIKTLIKDAGYDVTHIQLSTEPFDQVKATIEKQ